MSLKIKEFRKLNHLTQFDIAKLTGYRQTLVSRWENGEREPNIETVCLLADKFNISLDELFGREISTITTTVSKNAQQSLVDKVKYLNDDQCLTLCSIIETFGNDNKQILSDYKKLKKYEE